MLGLYTINQFKVEYTARRFQEKKKLSPTSSSFLLINQQFCHQFIKIWRTVWPEKLKALKGPAMVYQDFADMDGESGGRMPGKESWAGEGDGGAQAPSHRWGKSEAKAEQ